MVYFFIYVVAYQPSSYTELLSRQRLMLKILCYTVIFCDTTYKVVFMEAIIGTVIFYKY